jgi:hypothetical protein
MEQTLATAIEKLVTAGEHAGLSVVEMIGLLQAGLSVGALLDLIEVRLTARVPRSCVM